MANKNPGTAHPVGTVLRYCHEGDDRRAQVTEVHPEDHPEAGAPKGLVVYDPVYDDRGEVKGWNISHGVADPKPARSPTDRAVHGHFWKQV
jgi:hypothetical protein